ncbi:histone deacetylase family protein [Aquimonas sp.]|jgi:acetoin utilization deacetylase AcuC-like enzyme|uniref:histone deacetylase family protein n=1 Tax=Aquimonas sp. TaxID=1872588 RepID=UPI0037C156CC
MLLFTHPVCIRHSAGPGHPESPQRLATVLAALHALDELPLDWREAPRASREQLLRAHTPELVARILDVSIEHTLRIDDDTVMNADSPEAARHAAGAVCAAIDAVMAGDARRAFCAVRPPGHHATRAEAMGFCLINSVAVGAAHALEMHGLKRVAIIDFDVHHGNGSQDIFWDDPRVLYLSSHQSPLYPYSGNADETGAGNILNLPLPEGADGEFLRDVYRQHGLPALNAFRPELVLVSAGFDGHRLDPLAGLNLEAGDFAWLTLELMEIANRHAQGRLVSTLEGGYSLTALRDCSVAHVRALASAEMAAA